MKLNHLINSLDRMSWWFLSTIVIILFGFLIYSNSFSGALVMDDANVVKPEVTRILEKPSQYIRFGNQRFVADLTFALNYRLHQNEVQGYHIVNLTIHLVNSFLVFMLAQLLLTTPVLKQTTNASQSRLISLSASLFFLAHPIQTMAVSYITQRYASLATMFFILSFYFYLWGRVVFADCTSKSRMSFQSGSLWILSLVLFVLGLHTKTIVATLPLIVFISEWLLFNKGKFPWKLSIPLSIAVLSMFLFGLKAQSFHFMFFFSKPNSIGEVVRPLPYLATQFRTFLMYIRKVLVPLGLNADYYFPLSKSFLELGVLTGMTAWSGSVVLAWFLRKRYPLLSFCLWWFLLTPLISSSFIPILDVINEYRMYLPMVGFSLGLSVLIWKIPEKINQWGIGLFVVLLVLIYGVLTFNRNFVYQTELSYWGDVIKKSPQKARGYVNYAVFLHTHGKGQEALTYYQKALEIDPERLTALANIGVLYTQAGQYDKAIEYFDQALALDENYTDAINGLGVIYLNKGELVKAEAQFKRVLKIEPENSSAAENLEIIGHKRDL